MINIPSNIIQTCTNFTCIRLIPRVSKQSRSSKSFIYIVTHERPITRSRALSHLRRYIQGIGRLQTCLSERRKRKTTIAVNERSFARVTQRGKRRGWGEESRAGPWDELLGLSPPPSSHERVETTRAFIRPRDLARVISGSPPFSVFFFRP